MSLALNNWALVLKFENAFLLHLLYCWMSGRQGRCGSEATHFESSDLSLHCMVRHVIHHTWVIKVGIKGTAFIPALSHIITRCFSWYGLFVYLILKDLFYVLHCNFNMLNLPKLDMLGLDAALG